MRLAAATRGPQDEIVALPDGPDLLIYDAEAKQLSRHPNPGHLADQQRRLSSTEFLLRQGVALVFSVPLTFCPRSYAEATRAGLRFLRVPPGTTFSEALARWEAGTLTPTDSLADDELYHP